jgi:hypothetical protein
VKVYGAKDDECCSCTVTMNHFVFYFPTSHREVTIRCTDGSKKTIDLTPENLPHKLPGSDVRIQPKIDVWLWPTGSFVTSCDKVDDVLNNLSPVKWELCGGGDSMNCIGFAHNIYNKLNQCP